MLFANTLPFYIRDLSILSFWYQFSSVVQSCPTLWPYGLQHARLPCPSPTPRAYSNMSIESVMPSNHLILCCPLLLPSVFPSIRVFSKSLWKSWNQFPTNTERMTINPPFFELWMLACLGVQALIFLYLHQLLSWFHVDSSLITTFLHTAA